MTLEAPNLQTQLNQHEVFFNLKSLQALQVFMEIHVFAVWDFMSLVKSLQNKVCPSRVPWQPSAYPSKLVRIVNEIVQAEESDEVPSSLNIGAAHMSHFEVYLHGMREVGANTDDIMHWTQSRDRQRVAEPVLRFLEFHLNLAESGQDFEVAASLFHGRENIIPGMFESILENLHIEAPVFKYYLSRHVEVDAEQHGPMAEECMLALANTPEKVSRVDEIVAQSLLHRKALWDHALECIRSLSQSRHC